MTQLKRDHEQQRGMQELMQQIPTQAATPVEKLVEVTHEAPINRQRARETTRAEKTRRTDENKNQIDSGHVWK